MRKVGNINLRGNWIPCIFSLEKLKEGIVPVIPKSVQNCITLVEELLYNSNTKTYAIIGKSIWEDRRIWISKYGTLLEQRIISPEGM